MIYLSIVFLFRIFLQYAYIASRNKWEYTPFAFVGAEDISMKYDCLVFFKENACLLMTEKNNVISIVFIDNEKIVPILL